MWPNLQEVLDLVTFTVEILNGKVFVQWLYVDSFICKSENGNNNAEFLSWIKRYKTSLAEYKNYKPHRYLSIANNVSGS